MIVTVRLVVDRIDILGAKPLTEFPRPRQGNVRSSAEIVQTVQIALYDTSVGSPNIGDQIIMQSVESELAGLLPYAFVNRIPTHDRIGKHGRRLLRKADLVVAGGTNLLFSSWRRQRQWRLTLRDLAAIDRKLVLMGTGWASYLPPPGFIARKAYESMLSRDLLHSVRDSYSQKQLACAGVSQVLNTGCPTLWRLPEDIASRVPAVIGKRVITTLTDYRPAPEQDARMLETLKRLYPQTLLWMQGRDDLAYFKSLGVDGVGLLRPSLAAFDEALQEDGTDFAGTRLHAGIRALQKGRRALIISVDNRAKEMGRDFGLPVLERTDIASLEARLLAAEPLIIRLPMPEINAWRAQFMAMAAGQNP
jgi:polysaccharide pyruvyl transferase WcaK-like protein